MKRKIRKPGLYPHYRFDRVFAQAVNESHYERWLIMDEGQLRPYPQRWHNFLTKYGKMNKKTKKGILSYISRENMDYVRDWVVATRSERKQMLKEYPRWCTLFNVILKNAILQYENDILKTKD